MLVSQLGRPPNEKITFIGPPMSSNPTSASDGSCNKIAHELAQHGLHTNMLVGLIMPQTFFSILVTNEIVEPSG
jgi:hypothetical protein